MSKTWLLSAGAFAIAAYMIFMNLGLAPLINPDEGRNASIAWDMLQSGNWFVPTYDGLPYLDKPAFFFKLAAFSMEVFGKSELAVRLPSAIFAMGTLLLVYMFSRREYGVRTAALAVIVVGTTPLFFAFARYVIFDMTLAFFVCAAIFSGYYAEYGCKEHQKTWYRLSAASMGFGLLVKGPVGFVIPVLVLAVFNRLEGQKGAFKRLLSAENLFISIGIFMLWFAGVSYFRPDFPYYGIVRETFLRFTTNEFHRSQPFYFYPPVLFGTLLFWSFLLPQSIWAAWKNKKTLTKADRFLIVWVVVVTIFFSISHSKLPGYVLTASIALAVLIARQFSKAIESFETENPEKEIWSIVRNAGIALFVVSVSCLTFLAAWKLDPSLIKLHMKDPQSIPKIHALTTPLCIAFSLIILFAILGIVRNNAKLVFLSFLIIPLTIPYFVAPVYSSAEQHRTNKNMAQYINDTNPDTDIVCFHCFPSGLPFYIGKNIGLITEKNGAEIKSNYIPFALASSQNWPNYVLTDEGAKSWISTIHRPVLLIINKENIEKFQELTGKKNISAKPVPDTRYSEILLMPQGDK